MEFGASWNMGSSMKVCGSILFPQTRSSPNALLLGFLWRFHYIPTRLIKSLAAGDGFNLQPPSSFLEGGDRTEASAVPGTGWISLATRPQPRWPQEHFKSHPITEKKIPLLLSTLRKLPGFRELCARNRDPDRSLLLTRNHGFTYSVTTREQSPAIRASRNMSGIRCSSRARPTVLAPSKRRCR